MDNDGYSNLANAIIIQAANDYRKARKQLKVNPNYKYALRTMVDVVSFFESDWFNQLTDVDSDYILRRLAREEI